jgi:hypothetical protein
MKVGPLLLAIVFVTGYCLMGYVAHGAEADYRDNHCGLVKGQTELRNSDGTYTDCYLPDQSIEYDFARKWYECLGQAMHYARLNRNAAVCLLIVEKPTDQKYVDRADKLVEHFRLPVVVGVIP